MLLLNVFPEGIFNISIVAIKVEIL